MSLGSMLTSNLQLKLLSLLLAVLIWLLVILEGIDETELPLTVNYINVPAGLAVKPDQDGRFTIRVEGRRILLLRQRLLGVSVPLDLDGAGEGRLIFPGVDSQVKLIQGVKQVRRQPLRAELTLEQR